MKKVSIAIVVLAAALCIEVCDLILRSPSVVMSLSPVGLKPYMNARLIKALPGGDLLIGGGQGPWAARLDAAGSVKWEWESPDPVPVFGTSSFSDATVLADGRILLCGTSQINHRLEAFTTLLTADGSLLETKAIQFPQHLAGVPDLISCTKISTGVAIITPVIAPYTGWIMVADAAGKETWQKLTSQYSHWVSGVHETSDHSIIAVEAHNGEVTGEVTVDLFSAGGDISKSLSFIGNTPTLLSSLRSSKVIVLASQGVHKTSVVTLLDGVTGIQNERSIEDLLNPATRQGFVLDNGTVALFEQDSAGNVYAGHLGSFGNPSTTLLGARGSTVGDSATTSISGYRFVTVRAKVLEATRASSIELVWTKINSWTW